MQLKGGPIFLCN